MGTLTKLTVAEINLATADNGTRGLMPVQVKKAANLQLPDLYVDVTEVPAFIAKMESDPEYDAAKIKNAATGAIKNAAKTAALAKFAFPTLEAMLVADTDGFNHVLIVNQDNVAKQAVIDAAANENGHDDETDETV